MGYLEKKFLLHERDENGNILPINFFIEELNGEVCIIPTTRGELLRLTREDDELARKGAPREDALKLWEEFICKHIKEPKFTTEELRETKIIRINGRQRDIVDVLIGAIYKVSGIDVELKDSKTKPIEDTESELFREGEKDTG